MKKLSAVIFLLVFSASAYGQTCPSFRLSNPGFELPLATATGIGNWYGSGGPYGGGARLSSAEMSGSYVGVAASNSSSDHETLSMDILADDLNIVGILTFDLRPKQYTYAKSGGYMTVTAYDTGGGLVTGDVSASKGQWMLFGSYLSSLNQNNYYISSAVVDTTYTVTIDIKSMVSTALNAGKTWSDVSVVRLSFSANAFSGTYPVKYYIDNFR